MITPEEAIMNTSGRIFGATVITLDGRKREFNAKTMDYSFDALDRANGQVTVLENNASDGHGSPRSFKLDSVLEIRCGEQVRFPQNDRERPWRSQ